MRDAMARLQATVARHPRLLTTLLLVVLFVAVADPVAAGDGAVEIGTLDHGSTGSGPTNPSPD